MTKQRENKITNKSFFSMLLRSSGYRVEDVDIQYKDDDKRQWTIVINRYRASIFVTCYSDGSFHFWDGVQFMTNPRLKTTSFEVIGEHLHDCGILEKRRGYGEPEVEEIDVVLVPDAVLV